MNKEIKERKERKREAENFAPKDNWNLAGEGWGLIKI